MNVKVLGSGCAACKSMFNDVLRIVDRNHWNIEVEYVQDITKIMSYGVMSTPVLVVDEKVVMVGHHGSSKIEQALQNAANP
jgi:small redox-active disulfide protein 2